MSRSEGACVNRRGFLGRMLGTAMLAVAERIGVPLSVAPVKAAPEPITFEGIPIRLEDQLFYGEVPASSFEGLKPRYSVPPLQNIMVEQLKLLPKDGRRVIYLRPGTPRWWRAIE